MSKVHYNRLTMFSLKDLEQMIQFLGSHTCPPTWQHTAAVNPIPDGMLVNELGIIYSGSENPLEVKRAEQLLLRVLEHESSVRNIAYLFLAKMEDPKRKSKEVAKHILDFASREENKEFISCIQKNGLDYFDKNK